MYRKPAKLTMKNKNIRIDLIQKDSVLSFTVEMENEKLSVIAGTIAFRVVTMCQKVRKFKMNLNGFSFARKFDVQLTIEGESTNGTQVIANGTVAFGLTLQDKEQSIEKFGEFIKELVCDIMTGQSKAEVELTDLLEEVGYN